MTDNPEETGFSKEYVEKLRQEAASWRTKFRDLESQNTQSEVETELNKRGIKADPTWVKQSEGMTASDAVEDLVARYPHLVPAEPAAQTPIPPTVPGVQAPVTTATGVPTDPAKGRSLEEIKKDPVARAQLRERYRQLLKQASRQVDSI